VGARIAQLPAGEVIRKIIPFLIAGIIGLLIVTYIPAITMFLPNLIHTTV
jgi:C4-dicarboxylate transporter DctM subunit